MSVFAQSTNRLIDQSHVGMRIRHCRTLVLALPRAEPQLEGLLPLAARDPRVHRDGLGATRPARAHAFRDGGRQRDVGRERAGVRRRARGRPVARVSHRPRSRRPQRHGWVHEPSFSGGARWYRDVPRRAVPFGEVAARHSARWEARRRDWQRMLGVSSRVTLSILERRLMWASFFFFGLARSLCR